MRWDRGWSAIAARARPAVAYQLPDTVLVAPASTVRLTLEVFDTYGARGVEACCFWYGERIGQGEARIRAIVIPRQTNRAGNYRVDASAMEAVSSRTRAMGLVNLCQVHTHPGTRVEHSAYDDENAVSQRVLSVVFPHYGRYVEEWPHEVGVHEFQEGYWHLLSPDNAQKRLLLADDAPEPELVDLR